MIKCSTSTENLKALLDEGYSFRFNSSGVLSDEHVYVLSPEQLEEHKNILGDSKIATVTYKHRYLVYFLEHGFKDGFEKCKDYALKKLAGDEIHSS